MNHFHPALAPETRSREPHWYACRTRARAEKQVDQLLELAGFETFLPLLVQERQWADRKKRVGFPLFPGYTFARFRMGELPRVVRTRGLFTVVSEKGYPAPVREEELEAVRRFVHALAATGHPPEPRGRARVAVRLSAIRLAVTGEMDRRVLREVA